MADQFPSRRWRCCYRLWPTSRRRTSDWPTLCCATPPVVSRLFGAALPEDAIVSAGRDDNGDIALSLSMNASEGELDDGALHHVTAGQG